MQSTVRSILTSAFAGSLLASAAAVYAQDKLAACPDPEAARAFVRQCMQQNPYNIQEVCEERRADLRAKRRTLATRAGRQSTTATPRSRSQLGTPAPHADQRMRRRRRGSAMTISPIIRRSSAAVHQWWDLDDVRKLGAHAVSAMRSCRTPGRSERGDRPR
jgi:hypothetical protein